ncbi:MAG: CDP-alcohol phosphatidyltransferase family protein [Sphingomonas paucimobilis]
MAPSPPGGSRDPRIEDPSNRWVIHPLSRRLLPVALQAGWSANAVSALGLVLGGGAAFAYGRGTPAFAVVGLLLSTGWLTMDGLDGMVARATGTSSPLGRLIDGLCDHGVFVLIYVVLALDVGTVEGWLLALSAGAAHALQSSLYEGERARFHRRAAGITLVDTRPKATSPLLRLYDRVADIPGRHAAGFERQLSAAPDRATFGQRYAVAAVAPMRFLISQTANVRVAAIFIAMLAGDPRLFWWFEIGPLSIAAIVGLAWHRRVERSIARDAGPARLQNLSKNGKHHG